MGSIMMLFDMLELFLSVANREWNRKREERKGIGHAVRSCNENKHIIPYIYCLFIKSKKSAFFC